MSAEGKIDAALVGPDQGEVVTIRSLADRAEQDRYEAVRRAISGWLSSAFLDPRYNLKHPLSARYVAAMRRCVGENAHVTRRSRMMRTDWAQLSEGVMPVPEKLPLSLTINGVETQLRVAPWTSLLDLLRDHLDLTGTKKGCDHGQCGACTVLLDGRRINSCLTLAVMHDGAKVTTIEGLAKDGVLHALQQAFIDHDALQCGYCTPGQICSAAGLIAEGRATSADGIRELMSGNICRCGAYPNIVRAIQQAMAQS
jgi:xanthine dehydrogenase YagT iron-sulfur-binding subunit